MKKKCSYWRGHNFSKWEQIALKDLEYTNIVTGKILGVSGIVLYQERVCEKCGFKQINKTTA